jgi:hypothetical protein
MPSQAAALERLEADGLLRTVGGSRRTTARWQAAMSRAALRLFANGDPGLDLRVPIASAVIELYGQRLSDAELADLVEALLPIEAAELTPRPTPAQVGG